MKDILKLLLGAALLIALQACASIPAMPSPVPTLDPNFVKTAIAGTMVVASTQTAVAIPITGPSSTPMPTETATEMSTATEALSPTPAFTATASVTQVSVSVATNCRTGPGAAYPRVGGLLVGQVAQVVGRNADSTYWIIQNPTHPGGVCWLWGQFAIVTGDINALPISTPPPAPAPTATLFSTMTVTPAITSTPGMMPTPSATITPTP